MKFNKNKSVIIIHKKANRYKNLETIEGIQKNNKVKVLGFLFNKNTNCSDHINKIKIKLKAVQKMIFMSEKNELGKW